MQQPNKEALLVDVSRALYSVSPKLAVAEPIGATLAKSLKAAEYLISSATDYSIDNVHGIPVSLVGALTGLTQVALESETGISAAQSDKE